MVALLAVFVLAAAGCGGDDNESAATTPAGTAGTQTTAAEPISVGMVSDTGGLNDSGFNEFSINGFERAQETVWKLLSEAGEVWDPSPPDEMSCATPANASHRQTLRRRAAIG